MDFALRGQPDVRNRCDNGSRPDGTDAGGRFDRLMASPNAAGPATCLPSTAVQLRRNAIIAGSITTPIRWISTIGLRQQRNHSQPVMHRMRCQPQDLQRQEQASSSFCRRIANLRITWSPVASVTARPRPIDSSPYGRWVATPHLRHAGRAAAPYAGPSVYGLNPRARTADWAR